MPFGNDSLPTTVRMVKVYHNANREQESARTFLSPIKVVRNQLFLANRYKHLLIDAILAGREAYRTKRLELYPDYKVLDDKIADIKLAIDDIDIAIKKAKIQANRTGQKYVRPTELVDEKKSLSQMRKMLSVETKAMREKIKEEGIVSESVSEPLFAAAEAWANHPTDNDGNFYDGPCLYQATKRKAKEAVEQGAKEAEPEHKRWFGGGRLTVQLQHQWQKWAGLSAAQWAALSEERRIKLREIFRNIKGATWKNIKAGCWSSLIQIREEQRLDQEGKPILVDEKGKPCANGKPCKPLTIFRLRVASDKKGKPIFVDCPCILDDGWAWPKDAHCTWIYLVCRAKGRDFSYSLSFHIARSQGWEKEDRPDSGVVAVHPGYRVVESGIRVATWLSDNEMGELIIPFREASDEEIANKHDNYWERERVRSVEYAKKPEELLLIRDNLFNNMKDSLKGYFDNNQPKWAVPIKEWLDGVLQAEKMLKKRVGSKTTLLNLLRDWRNQSWPAALKERIGEWHYKETHLERWQTKQLAKWERHRLSRYRSFWAGLRRKFQHIIISDIDWAKLRENPPAEDVKNPALVKFRNIASPGLLVELVPAPFLKVDAEAMKITATCNECGGICDFDHADTLHECEYCGEIWDQDINAVTNTLATGKEMLRQQ